MLHRSSLTVLAAAVFTACCSVSLQANLITNGSFESPTVPLAGYTDYASGSTTIPNWTVVGAAGGVSIVSGTDSLNGVTFPAQDGVQYLDLTGDGTNSVEGVQQTITTTPGTNYTIAFWVGNVDNPGEGDGTTSTVNVNLGGLNGTLLFSATNSMTNSTTQTWQLFTTSFTASASTTTIDFLNGDPGSDNTNGLDNVSVNATSAAPEPGTLSFFAIASAVAVARRLRRKRVS